MPAAHLEAFTLRANGAFVDQKLPNVVTWSECKNQFWWSNWNQGIKIAIFKGLNDYCMWFLLGCSLLSMKILTKFKFYAWKSFSHSRKKLKFHKAWWSRTRLCKKWCSVILSKKFNKSVDGITQYLIGAIIIDLESTPSFPRIRSIDHCTTF